MHQDLIHLGQAFRQRRQQKNLTYKEIENVLSIRSHFLEAIEEGHLAKLISPIYVQGFIRKYAAFLDLDAEQLLEEHPYVLKILTEPADVAHDAMSLPFEGSGNLAVKQLGHENKRSALFWVAVSSAVIVAFWFLASYLGVF